MALNTVSSDRLSTNVKNTNFTSAEKQDLTDDIKPLLGSSGGGNKNLIINGACNVAQYGTSVSASSGGYTTVDRFQQSVSNIANGVDIAQASLSSSDTGPYEKGFRNAYKITNGNNTADTNDQSKINYKIESQDIACSGWDSVNSNSKVTLSFWVKSSVAQTFVVHINADDASKSYAFEYSATTSWTKITHVIPGASGVTFNNDNGIGLNIQWFLYMGTDTTDNSFTYNAWGAYSGSSRSRDMTTTWQTTDDATFEITGIQLEVGSVATEFEHEPFETVLRKCSRYYQKPINGNAQDIAPCALYYSSGHIVLISPIVTPMRATPSVTVTQGTNYYKLYSSHNSGGEAFQPTPELGTTVSYSFYDNSGVSGSAGVTGFPRTANASAKIEYNSEI